MIKKSEHNGYQDIEIEELKENFKITCHHIEIVNSELGECKTDIAVIKTILMRHDKLLWIVLSGIIGIIVTMFAQMLFRIPV
jgi:hypothetical protein